MNDIGRADTSPYLERWTRAAGRFAAVAVLAMLPAASLAQDVEQTRDNTLIVATHSLASEQWAPHRFRGSIDDIVGFSIFDTLVTKDPDTQLFIPGLAASWEPSNDFKTWTVTLKQGIPFHPGPDGQDYGTLTAEDVRFTWELYMRDDCLSSRCGTYRDLVAGDINNFEIIDEHTFALHGEEPASAFPALVGTRTGSMHVTSKAYWDDVGPEEASRHPIGTGPWRFLRHEVGESVTLQAVQNHHRQTPHFDFLQFRIIPEPAAQLAALRAGDLDMMPISLTLVPEAEAAGLRIISIPGTGTSNLYLGGHYPGSEAFDRDSPWIQADAPEKGLAVRQAMSLAIDRQAIADHLLLGRATPIIAPILYAPGHPFNNPDWPAPEYNLERAKELLAEGGYPDGFEVTMYLLELSGRPASIEIGQVIAGMLEELGLTVNQRPIDEGIFDGMRENRSSAGIIWPYIHGIPDEPVDRLSGYSPEDGGAEFYWQPVEDAVAQMNATGDYDERVELARELGDKFLEYSGPAIGILALDAHWAVSDRVGDWKFIVGDSIFRRGETVTKAN